MRLMKHVDRRHGVYRVRIVIPLAARHAFPDLPKSGDYAVSLGTRSEVEAFEKAPPIIAEIKRRIETAKRGPSTSPAPTPPLAQWPALTRLEVSRAIERWRFAAILRAESEHSSGIASNIPPFGEEAAALSELRYRLQQGRSGEIADFTARLQAALLSEGISVQAAHPVFQQDWLRAAFCEAWCSVEFWTSEFQQGVFRWDEDAQREPDQGGTMAQHASAVPAEGQIPLVTPLAVLDRFVAAKRPKSEDDLRYHWRRLAERLGDVPVSSVTSEMLEAFLMDLRRFPKTRKGQIEKLTFDEILRDHPQAGPPLTEPTVFKYFASYMQVFEYAAKMRFIAFNPVAAVMPRKPRAERTIRAYTPEEIEVLFSKPMFTGCSKTHSSRGELWGYRDQPGPIILRDGRYWMPILSLFHGNRMDEWGGAKVADIKRDGDIDYLDLTHRTLKNDTARRLVPIHPKLVEIGFLDYVAARRASGDVYLFPEFPHDVSEGIDPLASTRTFSKWWGLWSDANGFPDPSVNFHSFRHTFKRACRGKVNEEIHDIITGHKGGGGAGRGYGQGADLSTLADAIKRVEIPAFKLTRSG